MSAEILSTLKRIEAKLDAVLATRQQAERSQPQTEPAAAPNVATDASLDAQWGNPTVKFNPRDWTGTSCKGMTYADCPPEFLDMLANALEFFANKNAATDPKKAGYDRMDASRARGWALRLRNGWDKPKTGGASSYDFDDTNEGGEKDIPF